VSIFVKDAHSMQGCKFQVTFLSHANDVLFLLFYFSVKNQVTFEL
jgi:hypothetical protein